MKLENGQFIVYGNKLKKNQSSQILRHQKWMQKKFHYDPDEKYVLSVMDNRYLGDIFGLKDILRTDQGEPLREENAIIVSTIRMGYGHYRIAMAGASAARAMGFTPYWLDLLAIPGVTTDVINYCNHNYSFFSRLSQRSAFFNKYIWESVTTGERTLPGLWTLLNNWIVAWPWRFLKTNVKDYAMSELFKNLYAALPPDIPTLTSHMWNCMGAIAGGMTRVVDMMFDNWPMSFQLTEGAKHAVQGPAGYYGFRVMRGFDEEGKILEPVPSDALYYTGHHVDHELVENIETDCAARLRRMKNNEPRRLLVTMGGAGAQRELFKAIIEHCVPLVHQDKVALFVNLGDHKENWEWIQKELAEQKDLIQTHFVWEDTRTQADAIRSGPSHGIHVFLHDNTFHAVYATNYLMRVVDVMITKPSELAFYPVPIIFNQRVGGHEMWGAIRGAEIGNGTVESRSILETLQAIDMLTHHTDLLTLYCECIVNNKSIGIYDGAYKSVEIATGKKFERK
jgi:UDP-N-acetylglucosamine:LPS N-acetylglucosamine transferase